MTTKNPNLAHIRALSDLRRCAERSCASEESRLNPQRWDDAIAAAIAALNGAPAKSLITAVIVEGGIVQDIVSTDPHALGRVFVIDYDTEGATEDEISMVGQADGSDTEALVGERDADEAGIDLAEVASRYDAGVTVASGKPGRLPEDSAEDEAAVRAAGWKLDFDLFWTRKVKDGDLPITDAAEGFAATTLCYLRSAAMALAYDRRCAEGR